MTSRRRFLCGLALSGLVSATGRAGPVEPAEIAGLVARPLAHFSLLAPTQTRFGRLEWLGGLQLSDPAQRIGALSDLYSWDHGRKLLSVADDGLWFSADLATEADGRLTGMTSARMVPILTSDSRRSKDWLDAEGLAVRPAPGGVEAFVSLEGQHRILRFPVAATPDLLPEGIGQTLPDAPPAFSRMYYSKGLEALAAAPPGHPLGDALVAISEWPPRDGRNHLGFIIGGTRPGAFEMVRRDGFDVTSAAFLPGGDLVVLERRISLMTGPGMRLLRVSSADIRPGAVVNGEELMSANLTYAIDNMEGLAIDTAPDGSTVLTIVSDDNHSILQRTLLLRFKLLDSVP